MSEVTPNPPEESIPERIDEAKVGVYPTPPTAEPPKPATRNNRTLWIVLIVIAVLALCCCLVLAALVILGVVNWSSTFDYNMLAPTLLNLV